MIPLITKFTYKDLTEERAIVGDQAGPVGPSGGLLMTTSAYSPKENST